jgi:predicted TIM-barrel fold metal-dependent hydrolase
VIVDSHPHILAEDTVKYPIDPIGGVRSTWSVGVSFTVEELLAHMDEAQVAAATIVQASTVYGNDNSYVADSVSRYPERFIGVGGIDPRLPDALTRLDYWVRNRGLAGMRIFAGGSTFGGAAWLDDPALNAFWDLATSLKVPLHLQVRFEDTARAGAIAAAHPNLPIVARYPNVLLKVTNLNLEAAVTPRSTPQALIAALIGVFGARRIMWGSNFPNTRPSGEAPYAALVDEAQSALRECSLEERNWILAGTACACYPRLKGLL